MNGYKSALNCGEPARANRAVEVIDCTLRDGEQTPGVWFTVEEKLELATLLSRAGVAVLDAGFPASSESEVEALQEMRRLKLSARIGATARPLKRDIEAAVRARAEELFLFFPTSDLRIRETLGVDRSRARTLFRSGVEEAAGHGLGVNIVFEDATRSDPNLLLQMVRDVTASVVVSRVIIADTVGCALPHLMEELTRTLRKEVPAETALCVHTHNDYGLATANTLAAVVGGATSVTCTVNGIGERAGNADLAETVAGLEHLLHRSHGINPRMFAELSRTVERLTGILSSPTKPVTGSNVFRHESGIHVDGMLKDQRSYEHLPASWLGRNHEYVLGKNSGTSLLRRILDEAGAPPSEEAILELLAFVRSEMNSRSKEEHGRASRTKAAFEEVALGGVSPALVRARALGAASGRYPLFETPPRMGTFSHAKQAG